MKNIFLIAFVSSLFILSCDTINDKTTKHQSLKCWDEDSVFPMQIDADQYASYKEGDEALLKFLATETKYPMQAKENGEQGKVFVRFVVKKDGSVSDVDVIRGISKSLDAEAIRVAQMTTGKWNPGKKGGEAVNVYMTLPIHFQLK